MSGAGDIRVDGLRKRFGGVQALDGASLTLAPGEVHALVGANGAGKSTLKNVLAGIVAPDEGTITIDGAPVTMRRAADALGLGIRAVHQEIGLIPWMSVQDNVHLGQFPTRVPGFLQRRAMRRDCRAALAELGLEIDPRRPVRTLSVGQQQLVEIARATLARPRALLLDEPSAVLVGAELERLFAMIDRLRSEGVAIFYVSHRFDEIFRLADRVTVMRNGATVAHGPIAEFDHDRLIREMIGHTLDRSAAARQAPGDDVRLEVRDLQAGGRLRDISFSARRGEILGIAGLMGSGRSHLLKTIYGIDRRDGEVLVDGAALPRSRPKQAIRRGLLLVPEDRKQAGLVLPLSVQRNIALPNEAEVARHGVVRRGLERDLGARLAAVVGVDPSRLASPVYQLSGGNQQKVALAKWLAEPPAVLVVDEPTRGIDVEAKAEIHAQLTRLAAQGVTVLVVSSEWDELLSLCHRLLVMRDGRIVGEGPADELTEEDLLRMCSPTATEELVP